MLSLLGVYPALCFFAVVGLFVEKCVNCILIIEVKNSPKRTRHQPTAFVMLLEVRRFVSDGKG